MKTTIELAREAGGRAQANQNCDDEYLMSVEQLKAFEALVCANQREIDAAVWRGVVEAEREACAKVCEETLPTHPDLGVICATAIRARGNT
jgi:hypothetical protein